MSEEPLLQCNPMARNPKLAYGSGVILPSNSGHDARVAGGKYALGFQQIGRCVSMECSEGAPTWRAQRNADARFNHPQQGATC